MKKLIVLTTVLILIVGGLLAVPDIMNYQGRAFSPPGSGTPVPDSTGNTVSVRIYANPTDPVGVWLWEQTITGVETKNGYFNIQFGGFGGVLDFNQDYWLAIEFNGDGEMSPRQQLLSAPFAMKALSTDTIDSNTKGFGPIGITSSSTTMAGLCVTSTGNTGIWGVHDGLMSNTAGVAGYNYSPSSYTAGVYGYAQNGIGVYGQASGTATTGVQGESTFGVGVHGHGVTGVVATSEPGGTALLVDGTGSTYPMLVGGGGANNVLFTGPGLTIDSGGYPAALWVSFTAGSWPAMLIDAPNGQALQIHGAPGGMGQAIVDINGNTSLGNMTGLSVVGGISGIAVSATAMDGMGVRGVGVTGVAGISLSPTGYGVWAENTDMANGYALYAYGRSYFYGYVTVEAVNPMGGSLNVFNNAGTGQAIYADNFPGTAVLATGSTGVRGEGQMYGTEGIGLSTGAAGVHAFNDAAQGFDTGAALFVEGKIKAGPAVGGNTVDSPVGSGSVPAGVANPSVAINNNLCYGTYHVYITPLNDWRDSAGQIVSYWVDKTNPGQFLIHTNSNGNIVPAPLDFEYLIINE